MLHISVKTLQGLRSLENKLVPEWFIMSCWPSAVTSTDTVLRALTPFALLWVFPVCAWHEHFVRNFNQIPGRRSSFFFFGRDFHSRRNTRLVGITVMRPYSQICNHHKEEPEECAHPCKILSNTHYSPRECRCHRKILMFFDSTRTSVFLQIDEVIETLDKSTNKVPGLSSVCHCLHYIWKHRHW